MTADKSAAGNFFRSGRVFISALTLAALLPFINEPFRVDEPLALWAARSIRQHPLNFYGDIVNWSIAPQIMWLANKNPPFTAYCIALLTKLFGWREFALHGAFLLVGVAAALGTYALAERMSKHPALASTIAVLTPVFLLCSTTIMCDTMMVALWLWATVLWMRGLDAQSHWRFALAALLIAIAFVTKYFGLALVPLLLVYGLARKRRFGAWALWLFIPLAAVSAYQLYTKHLYGVALFSDAAAFPTVVRSYPFGFAIKLFAGFSFLGGCLFPMVLFGFGLAARKTIAMWMLRALIVAVLLVMLVGHIGHLEFWTDAGIRWDVAAQVGIFCIAGVALLGLPILDLVRARDADSLLLFLWSVGTFIFASFMNWGATGRTFLPLVPPFAILVVRRMEARLRDPETTLRFRNWKVYVPLAAAAAMSLAITSVDYRLASSAKHAAELISRHFRNPGHTMYYQGHWGWQWYMDSFGGVPFDFRIQGQPGDVIVIPANNTEAYRLHDAPLPQYEVDMPNESWMTLQSHLAGVGFYGFSQLEGGPTPFLLSPPPPERYFIIVWR